MTTRVESVKRFFSPLFLTIYSWDEIHCKCNATALEELICNDDLKNNIWESKNKLDEGYKTSLTLDAMKTSLSAHQNHSDNPIIMKIETIYLVYPNKDKLHKTYKETRNGKEPSMIPCGSPTINSWHVLILVFSIYFHLWKNKPFILLNILIHSNNIKLTFTHCIWTIWEKFREM